MWIGEEAREDLRCRVERVDDCLFFDVAEEASEYLLAIPPGQRALVLVGQAGDVDVVGTAIGGA